MKLGFIGTGLAWALVCFLGGSGILAYIIAAIIIPSESTRNNNMM